MHFLKDWPHAGGCAGCRINRRCNVCGAKLDSRRCTNGRCSACHGCTCTHGGETSPGHGYGKPVAQAEGKEG